MTLKLCGSDTINHHSDNKQLKHCGYQKTFSVANSRVGYLRKIIKQ